MAGRVTPPRAWRRAVRELRGPVRLRGAQPRLVAVALGWLAGCASPSGPSLEIPGEESKFGLTVRDVEAGQSYLFGAVPLCVRDAASETPTGVRVTDVRPAEPVGGLSIRDFAVRKHPVGPGHSSDYLGSEPGVMPDDWDAEETVSLPCPSPGGHLGDVDRLYELVVEARKPGPETASTTGLVVVYESDGEQKEMRVPLTLVMCSGPVDDQGRCRRS